MKALLLGLALIALPLRLPEPPPEAVPLRVVPFACPGFDVVLNEYATPDGFVDFWFLPNEQGVLAIISWDKDIKFKKAVILGPNGVEEIGSLDQLVLHHPCEDAKRLLQNRRRS